MNFIINYNQPNLTKIVGLILIISAISFWAYSSIELKGYEVLITNPKLAIDQVNSAQVALSWWENFYSTIVNPVTIILILSGIATILVPQLLPIYKQQSRPYKFQKNIDETFKEALINT